MNKCLESLTKYTLKGVEEFSKNPIKYTTNSVKSLIVDYWDVGLAVYGGLHFRLIFPVESGCAFGISLLSYYQEGNDESFRWRTARNFCTALATASLKEGQDIPHITAGVLLLSMSIAGEIKRRKHKKPKKFSYIQHHRDLEKAVKKFIKKT